MGHGESLGCWGQVQKSLEQLGTLKAAGAIKLRASALGQMGLAKS